MTLQDVMKLTLIERNVYIELLKEERAAEKEQMQEARRKTK
tara:strand:- start:2581 stop:2703 length:123 start_codon:yes stop_codon:yes gene_type:complete